MLPVVLEIARQLRDATLVIVALTFAGCGESVPSGQNSPTAHEDSGSAETRGNGETLSTSFKPGQGLWVPEVTRQALALQIVEVSERNVTNTLLFQTQVFRAANAPGGDRSENRHLAAAVGMVSNAEARKLKPNQTVSVRAEGDSTQLQGRIAGLSEQMAKATGFVEVQVEFEDLEHRFAIGSSLEAVATLDTVEKAIAVPPSALLHTAEGDCVYVVNEKYLFRTAVTSGATDGDFVEIKDGLYSGDQVASHPVMPLWLAELAAVKGGQSCCLTKPAP